jgi:hypothetical protein
MEGIIVIRLGSFEVDHENIFIQFSKELKNFILVKNKFGHFIYEIDKENYGCKLIFHTSTFVNSVNIENIGYFYKIDKIIRETDILLYQNDNLNEVINKFQELQYTQIYNL